MVRIPEDGLSPRRVSGALLLADRAVDFATLPPLAEQPWQNISSRYKSVLRMRLLLRGLAVAVTPWVVSKLNNGLLDAWAIGISAVVLLVIGFLVFVWVPRKVRFTRYVLRELDMNMQTGCWWRRTLSVGINRIQHLEVTQGPLERFWGLSTLVLYTAGGSQSDLKLPGLESERARQLKSYLTDRVASEEAADAEFD